MMHNALNKLPKVALLLLALSLSVSSFGASRIVRAGDMSVPRLATNCLSIVLDAQGDENALGLSLCFDTNLLAYTSARRGAEAADAGLNVNTNQLGQGRLGFTMALPSGSVFAEGPNTLLEVCFRAQAGGGLVTTPVAICDLPVLREVVNAEAGDLTAIYSNAMVTVIGTCSYALVTNALFLGEGGGAGAAEILADAGCHWSVENANPWITLSSDTNGAGQGIVSLVVEANTNLIGRTGTMTIAGLNFTVHQEQGSCASTINPTERAHGSGAESGEVTVTSQADCVWTVVQTNFWITITSGTNGSGDETVEYDLAANPGTITRTGIVTIARHSFTITQAGVPCAYAIAPTSRLHESGLDTGVVTVTSISGCSWAGQSSLPWVAFAFSTNAAGSGTIGYTVAANASPVGRTGVVTIAGLAFTISQLEAACSYQLEPAFGVHGYGSETGQVSVAAFGGCNWTVGNTNAWITITSGTNRFGSGLVRYTVAANPNTFARSSVITIAGQPFPVSQVAAPCNFTLTPSNRVHNYAAEATIFNVSAPAGCEWTVFSTVPWMVIKLATNGSGNGIVRYTVTDNPDPFGRSGTLIVNGQEFSVYQVGAPCTYDLLRTDQLFSSDTGRGSVTLATAGGCPWTVINTNPWIRITSAAEGSGGATVNYDVAASLIGADRTGVFTVAGLSFTVVQFGTACRYTVAPAGRTHDYKASTGLVGIITTAQCLWPVGNTSGWITVLSPTNGVGNGTVTYAVAASFDPDPRTAVLSIAGQPFTVTQLGTPCRYALSQDDRTHGYELETGTVSVLTSNTCTWPMVNTNSWILSTITSGSGPGDVDYTVLPNPVPLGRTGLVFIAELPYAIVQAPAPCSYLVAPSSQAFGHDAGGGEVQVSAFYTCGWRTTSADSWITITSGQEGMGDGTVTYTVAPNPNPVPRSSIVTIGDQFFIVIQAAAPCTYALSATNQSHGSGFDVGSIGVAAHPVCSWTSANTNNWISIASGSSGIGNGAVLYTVTANPLPIVRSGAITVAGQAVAIAQAAAPCAYGISPTTRSHTFAAETGLFNMTTFSNCTWQAATTNDWITLTIYPEGIGNATIGYQLAANPIPFPRTGAVMVAERTLTVVQGAAPCAFALAPAGQTHGYGADTGSLSVATFFTCGWTAASLNNWISIISGASGTGDGQMRYAVTTNPTLAPRTGVISVAGQPFAVSQAAGPCPYALSPVSRGHGYLASTGAVSLLTSNVCSWTVSNTNDWITITAGASGTGNGTVRYAFETNSIPVSRSGVITIAEQLFTLVQAPGPCSYVLLSSGESHGAGVEAGEINVATFSNCTWTASSSASWITITSINDGMGDGSVTYVLATNPIPVVRTGTIIAAGRTFTVTQAIGPCSYVLAPVSRTHSFTTNGGSISVIASNACSWSVLNTNDWITITTGFSGNGTGVVRYLLATNPIPLARTGVLTIGEQFFTVTQAAAPCSATLLSYNQSHGAGIETGQVDIATFSNCAWTASSPTSWISLLSPANGIGDGSVSYVLGTNPIPVVRTGTIIAAGQTFVITQAIGPCSYVLSPTSRSHGFNTNGGSISVIASNVCSWSVLNTNDWITITAGFSGTGTGVVRYLVATNPIPLARTGVLTIGEQSFTIIQSPAPCSFALLSSNQSHGAGAEAGEVDILTFSNCAWTAASPTSWISLLSPANGIGDGSVSYVLGTNPIPVVRTGTIIAAGQTFVITQAIGPCSYVLSPASRGHTFNTNGGSISVIASNVCSWSVLNTNDWITITAGFSGNGTGVVRYLVATNPIPLARTGVLTIGEQPFTIIQSAAPCSYALLSYKQSHGAGVEAGQVDITTFSNCAWTAVSSNNWITFSSATNGTGDGSIGYLLATNSIPYVRTGVVAVAGQSYLVTQAPGPCSYLLSLAARNHSSAAGIGTVSVIASNVCSWSVLNTNDWLQVLSTNNSFGTGVVRYSFATNSIPIERSGVLTIADLPFTVTQAGAPCAYLLTPTNQAHGFLSETGQINLTTFSNCAWTAVTTNGWITITASTSGVGDGTVSYQLAANPGAARVGRLFLGSSTFVITQALAPPVVITSQPVSQGAALGGFAVFNVTAIGAPPLSYQWRFNGSNLVDDLNLSGTGAASLTLLNVQPAQAGNYSVVVSNSRGPITSSQAALTINRAPSLSPLADRTVGRGGLIAFTATATDPDLPAQTLRFSLDAGAPAEASINATNGVFSWSPPAALDPGTNAVAIRVSDNGSPPLSDVRTVFINVIAGFTTNLTLIRTGAVWKYLDTGTNLGTAWVAPGFDDSAWASGRAVLGYGNGNEATLVSFGTNANNKYITTYFRASFAVLDPALFTALSLRVLRDDGVVIYLNGVEIQRDNMPAGAINYLTGASSSIGGNEESTYFPGPPLDPVTLAPCDNVMAVELHNRNASGSDLSFDLELFGSVTLPDGTSLPPPADPLVRITLDPGVAAILSWNACVGGRYRVEYAGELPATSWTDLAGEIIATSHTATLADPFGGAQQRFYRVLRND